MPDLELRARLSEALAKATRPEGEGARIAKSLREDLEAAVAGIGVEADETGEFIALRKSEAEDLAGVLTELVEAEDDPGKLRQLLQKVKNFLSGANLLTNLRVPRVDLVHSPANMRTFLVTKSNPVTGEEDLELCELDSEPPDWWEG